MRSFFFAYGKIFLTSPAVRLRAGKIWFSSFQELLNQALRATKI